MRNSEVSTFLFENFHTFSLGIIEVGPVFCTSEVSCIYALRSCSRNESGTKSPRLFLCRKVMERPAFEQHAGLQVNIYPPDATPGYQHLVKAAIMPAGLSYIKHYTRPSWIDCGKPHASYLDSLRKLIIRQSCSDLCSMGCDYQPSL